MRSELRCLIWNFYECVYVNGSWKILRYIKVY